MTVLSDNIDALDLNGKHADNGEKLPTLNTQINECLSF